MPKNITDIVALAKSTAKVEHYPTPKDRLVKGEPEQNNTLHFSADDRFFVGAWGAEVGMGRRSWMLES